MDARTATGCTDEARLLLESGADPNLADKKGSAPLARAAQASGDAGLGVARLLLDAKADIDHQNTDGVAALHAACHFSNVEVVRLLLERGANQKDGDGDGAECYTQKAVRKEEVLALLSR